MKKAAELGIEAPGSSIANARMRAVRTREKPPAPRRLGERTGICVLVAAILAGCSTSEPNPSPASSHGGTPAGGASGSNTGGGGISGAAGVGSNAGRGPSGGASSGGAALGGAAGSGGLPNAGTSGAGTSGAGRSGGAGTSGGGEIVLEPGPGNYRQTCDGSLGVFLDGEHFLDGNDEDQALRIYRRGADGIPLRTLDVSSALGLASSDEADLEDAARIGNRIYVVSSHSRDGDGNLESARYRFFAADISGTVPDVTLAAAGSTTQLLEQLLSAANWASPNASVIATLAAASNLGVSEDEDLAPEADGTSIEALAWFPTAVRPKQLLVGFRNPTQGGDAVVVSLLNADALLTGTTASFGEATLLDLGGLGLRAMTWSPLHGALLLLAGPKAAGGPFRLLSWSGPPSTAPVLVRELTGLPADSSPEALVVYPNTRDIQVLLDQGDHLVGGTVCKDVSASNRAFTDLIVHVP
jgi:hypothetical protein